METYTYLITTVITTYMHTISWGKTITTANDRCTVSIFKCVNSSMVLHCIMCKYRPMVMYVAMCFYRERSSCLRPR